MQNEQQKGGRRVSAAGIVVPVSKATSPSPLPMTEPTSVSKRVSIASVRVPSNSMVAVPAVSRKPPRTHTERVAFFDGLRVLRDSLPPNKNDRAIVLIVALIEGGVRTKREIVRALVYLGLNPAHAGKMVDREAEASAAVSPRWRKGRDGLYSLVG